MKWWRVDIDAASRAAEGRSGLIRIGKRIDKGLARDMFIYILYTYYVRTKKEVCSRTAGQSLVICIHPHQNPLLIRAHVSRGQDPKSFVEVGVNYNQLRLDP